jgi:hypothetical protein
MYIYIYMGNERFTMKNGGIEDHHGGIEEMG